ncbi:MAG: tetrahydromethanopterin S-methyltransferase subunit H family protein [Candidatus Helarchaeota archaeon]
MTSIINIANTNIGGNQGENPVVLIPSIFYKNHNIVSDPDNGIFDEEKAKKLIENAEKYSTIFNIPYILDLVADTPKAMKKYLDFLISDIEFKRPILFDAHLDTRMKSIQYIKDIGILDQVIYNSIWQNPKEEIELLKEVGIKNLIIFVYDAKHTRNTAIVRWRFLTEPTEKRKSLLDIAKYIGAKNLLIDNVLTEYQSLADAIEANIMMKSGLGYPVGCGPANVSWHIKNIEKNDYINMTTRDSSLISISTLFSDFLLMGPIERVKHAFGAARIAQNIKEMLNIDFFNTFG